MDERQRWAVAALAPRVDERVLELGCGHGVALALLCDAVGDGGQVTGLDRSAKMIAAARRRTDGRAILVEASLADSALEPAAFDAALALHFPPLLRGAQPDEELAVLRRALRPGGRVVVAAEPQAADGGADEAARRLRRAGFAVEALDAPPGRWALRARPSSG